VDEIVDAELEEFRISDVAAPWTSDPFSASGEIPEFTANDLHRLIKATSDQWGRINLAVFGKTGVGKSTLINAFFGRDVAATGIGHPVTGVEHMYTFDDGSLGLLDTRGVEIGADNTTILAELRRIVADNWRQPVSERLHAIWYCVRATDARFEASENSFIRECANLGIPVIVVLLQVHSRIERSETGQGTRRIDPAASELAKYIDSLRLPIGGTPVLVMAKPDEFGGWPVFGLPELLERTLAVIPESARRALIGEQQVDFKAKAKSAKKVIASAVTAAAATGATPIPFADAAVLVPIQVAMMLGISKAYGVRLDKAAASAMVATGLATTTGKNVVSGILKVVPGAGTVVGGAISAAVAGTITTAMGTAWMRLCEMDLKGEIDLDNIPVNDLRALFITLVRQSAKGQKHEQLPEPEYGIAVRRGPGNLTRG